MTVNPNVYDRHVLVTGGAGFIGSHFLEHYVSKRPNYHFTCIDKLNYASENSTKNLESIMKCPNFTFIKHDLTDFVFLFKLLVTDFEKNEITHIVNFAAESSVDRSFIQPHYFVVNNILCTQTVLDCFRLLYEKHRNENIDFRFLHISTDEVYGDIASDVNESGTLCPTNPYSASKASIDLIINSYRYSWKLPITIIRPNNVYGPRQFPEKLIPLSIHCLNEDVLIPIHGDGSNKRCYLHIRDFLSAFEYIWSTEASKLEPIYNVGGAEEITNMEVVRLICQLYFSEEYIAHQCYISFAQDRKYNDSGYAINCDKIKALGWSPKVELKDGIKEMIGPVNFTYLLADDSP